MASARVALVEIDDRLRGHDRRRDLGDRRLLGRVDATEGETAERLGISVANVKIWAHRARKQLRESLEAVH